MRKWYICLVVLLLSGCATLLPEVPGNYPEPKRKNSIPPSQRSYPNEIFAAPNFKISKGPWFDLEAARKDYETDKAAYQDAPASIRNAFENNEPSQMVKAMTQYEGFAFVKLGFWLNPDTHILFRSAGGLILDLQGPNGQTVQLADQGCIFFYRDGTKVRVYDSYEEAVNFDRTFNNKPDYRKMPNIVYARIDEKYYGWKVVGLKLDYDKLVVQ